MPLKNIPIQKLKQEQCHKQKQRHFWKSISKNLPHDGKRKKQSVHYRILKSHKDTLHGPSDWIRTSGLLNPIQARYQTSPHPDVLTTWI